MREALAWGHSNSFGCLLLCLLFIPVYSKVWLLSLTVHISYFLCCLLARLLVPSELFRLLVRISALAISPAQLVRKEAIPDQEAMETAKTGDSLVTLVP